MKTLKEALESFKLSKETRDAILKDKSVKAPKEFKEIAEVVLAGHFEVKGNGKVVKVYPTCVEFYYHEEQEGGIKDYIVYHRNSKSDKKKPFHTGILHNHQSGIDITFEQGKNAEDAIRASMLIREFKIDDGERDSHSTHLYDALYQQTSIFQGISVQWVDGEKEAKFIIDVRKNVSQYKDGKKVEASKDSVERITENKKYVQDLREWQFTKQE